MLANLPRSMNAINLDRTKVELAEVQADVARSVAT